jgi:hypothetical protein
VLAGILSALCLLFSWRAYRRCRLIHAGMLVTETDPVEKRFAESELNLELNLAQRNVGALARAASFGGGGLAFWCAAHGEVLTHPFAFWGSGGLGLLGWAGCKELQRRIGSLAGAWRAATNQKRRRQGVDQSERTG